MNVEEHLNSDWLAQKVRDRAEEIAARARALAPKRSGQLAASISVSVAKHSGVKRDRVVAFVTTDAHAGDGSGYGSPSEFGTTESRGNFFLRRAAGML